MNVVQRARLVSYIPLGAAVGFALPVFISATGGNEPFVQSIDEWRGTIARFVPIDAQLRERGIGEQLPVEIGDPQIYVFITPDDWPLCGTAEQLTADLRYFANQLRSWADIRLQIFELIGDFDEKFAAREVIQSEFAKKFGWSSARIYSNSALRQRLWGLLLENAPDRTAADRVILAQSRLDARFDERGKVRIDVSVLQKDCPWIQQLALQQTLAKEFGLPKEGWRQITNTLARPKEDRSFAERVKSLSRQEERLVLLLRELLDEPNIRPETLRAFPFRTKFELRALSEIEHLDGLGSDREVEFEVALVRLADRLYQHSFTARRGALLLLLAEKLGHRPMMREFIRRKVRRSTALSVVANRPEIFRALGLEEVY